MRGQGRTAPNIWELCDTVPNIWHGEFKEINSALRVHWSDKQQDRREIQKGVLALWMYILATNGVHASSARGNFCVYECKHPETIGEGTFKAGILHFLP